MKSSASRAPVLRMSRTAGVTVLLMHGMLAGLLWQLPAWDDRQAAVPVQQPLLVRLWWAAAPPQQGEPPLRAERSRMQSARPTPTPTPTPQTTPRSAEPKAITDPSAAAAAAAAAAVAVGPVTEAPARAAAAPGMPSAPTLSAPLNLTLPRGASAPWRQRNPALDDPRANTAKLSLEQKLANAMGGDGTWVMERVDLNTIRYRRGGECVQMIRSRAGQLELGGGAFRESWLARDC